MEWMVNNPFLCAALLTIVFEIVRNWKGLWLFFRWLPSEIKAEYVEHVLKLPDARSEKPDYSDWQFINTIAGWRKSDAGYGKHIRKEVVVITPFSMSGFVVYFCSVIGLLLLGEQWEN